MNPFSSILPFLMFYHALVWCYREKYLSTNIEAIENKVKFQRVFVNSPQNLREMIPIMKKQKSNKIDVYAAPIKDVNKDVCNSFIIMDDKVLTQVKYTSDGRISEWETVIDPIKVSQAVKKFNVLLRRAKTIEDFETEQEAHETE